MRSSSEEGVALVTVLLVMMVVTTMLLYSVANSVASMSLSRHDQDWNAALAAAQAGVDDYLYRLNQNSNYWLYSKGSPPPDGNKAFQQFVAVPGPTNQGTFSYAADTSTIASDGTIKLTSVGQVHGVKRTVYTTLRRRNFLDYLYFTDIETQDPAMYTGNPFTPAQAQTKCARHSYDSPARDSNCTLIVFFSRDVINGPLHSNDALNICGAATFNGPTSDSWNDPANKRWIDQCPTSHPVFANSGDPKYAPPLNMPPSNSAMKTQTLASAGGTGCLYTGPTQITLNSTTMNVISPFTKSTNAGCGPGNNLALPPNGVIYVQNVPSISTDPNYTNGCPYSGNYPHGLIVPVSGDITTYNCRDGDVFLSGTLKGNMSIASEHDINITWNLQYGTGGTTGTGNLLGLVANNYVSVFHPVDDDGDNLNIPGHSTPFNNATIQAAILSVQHSFRVQNFDDGSPLGNLNITGAIAQEYRGAVGTFSGTSSVSGYTKNYVYDTRLKYLSPPYFLDPVKSAWGVATWAEIHTPGTFP
jgi:hypothetical protein